MAKLVPACADGHKPGVDVPEIFDRALRRIRRDRAQPLFGGHAFLRDAIVEALLDRLDLVNRRFTDALDLGCADGAMARALEQRGIKVTRSDPGAAFARTAGGTQHDEDRLPFPPASFDLIVAAGSLDTVNDLPGALIQCRRALRPDGLYLAGFVGAGSLPRLRRAVAEADALSGGATPARFHPGIEVRAAGDLLARAGFVLTVADSEALDVRYGDVFALIRDLRGMAATNMLAGQRPPWFGRLRSGALADAFATQADGDGRVSERVTLVFMTGWSPGPDQPQPARRGSATVPLGEALKRS